MPRAIMSETQIPVRGATTARQRRRRVLIGLSGSILNSLTEHLPETPADSNGRDAVASVVRRLPIEVDVVLGSWKVPLHELLELRAGDRIVLPDGEDASLSASGVRATCKSVLSLSARAVNASSRA